MTNPIGRRISADVGTGETFQVFVTKWAMTYETGILVGQGRLVADDPKRVAVKSRRNVLVFEGEGEEWHRTLDGARDHLHALVKAKLGDLTNQMAAARQLLAKAKKMEARPI